MITEAPSRSLIVGFGFSDETLLTAPDENIGIRWPFRQASRTVRAQHAHSELNHHGERR